MTDEQWARETVTAILDDLADRSGFDEWWVDISLDVRRSLRKDLAKIVLARLGRLPRRIDASVSVGTVEAGASVVGVQL